MSQIGKQLVDNERQRAECFAKAKRLLLELLVKLSADNEWQVAEIDTPAAQQLLNQVAAQRQVMRNLQKEYRELSAAASGS